MVRVLLQMLIVQVLITMADVGKSTFLQPRQQFILFFSVSYNSAERWRGCKILQFLPVITSSSDF